MYRIQKPVKYGGKDGLLVKIEKEFDNTCLALQQRQISDPKKMTVFEYYNAIDFIEKSNPKRNGKQQRHK